MRYTHNRIGSRNERPTVYWLDGNVRFVVGCFNGNLIELKKRIDATYPEGHKHRIEYDAFIAIARTLISKTSTTPKAKRTRKKAGARKHG